MPHREVAFPTRPFLPQDGDERVEAFKTWRRPRSPATAHCRVRAGGRRCATVGVLQKRITWLQSLTGKRR